MLLALAVANPRHREKEKEEEEEEEAAPTGSANLHYCNKIYGLWVGFLSR